MKVRYIQMSPPDGDLVREQIIFTDDFDSPADNFCENGMVVYIDAVVEMPGGSDYPDGGSMPINQVFSR